MHKIFKKLKRPRLYLFQLPQFSIVVFIVFNVLAMITYAGGTYFEPHLESYSLSKNFFSDLGRRYNFIGESNIYAYYFFNSAIVLSGGTFILFFIFLSRLFSHVHDTNKKVCAQIASFFGVIGGLSLMGVGLIPLDYNIELHKLCASWTFRSFFPCTLIYAYVLLRSKRFSNVMASSYLIWSIVVLCYVLSSELGPSSMGSNYGLMFQVIAQKLIVFSFVLNILFQTLHLSYFFNKQKQLVKTQVSPVLK